MGGLSNQAGPSLTELIAGVAALRNLAAGDDFPVLESGRYRGPRPAKAGAYIQVV
jgi:hypothetical protein